MELFNDGSGYLLRPVAHGNFVSREIFVSCYAFLGFPMLSLISSQGSLVIVWNGNLAVQVLRELHIRLGTPDEVLLLPG